MDPVDPRPALRGIDRPGGAEHEDRHAVAPGVEDRHRRVHQPDIAVHDRAHRAAGRLGIAVRDRDRVLLVQTQQHLRVAVAEQVDEAVVQPAIGGAGVQRDIGQVKFAQHQRDRVAAPVIARLVGENGPLDGARTGCGVTHALPPLPEPPPTGPLSGGDGLGVGARLRPRRASRNGGLPRPDRRGVRLANHGQAPRPMR